jgi:hypothetical protein
VQSKKRAGLDASTVFVMFICFVAVTDFPDNRVALALVPAAFLAFFWTLLIDFFCIGIVDLLQG